MFVLTLTHRGATGGPEAVDALLTALAPVRTAHAFHRSWGDEVVGAVDTPAAAVQAALVALRAGGKQERRFAVGLGVGPCSRAEDGALTGPAAARSRRAVESVARAPMPLAVEAGPAGVAFEGLPSAPEAAAAAEGVLRLLGDLITRRSEAEWAVVDLLVPGVRGQQKEVAAALGISVQAVSQSITRAQFVREGEGRAAATLLLSLVAQAVE